MLFDSSPDFNICSLEFGFDISPDFDSCVSDPKVTRIATYLEPEKAILMMFKVTSTQSAFCINKRL
jgi:hypothetical protein